MADDLADEREWLRRAALLVNREPALRRQIGLFLAGGAVLGPFLNVLEYSLTLGVVFRGLGWGLFVAGMLAVVTVSNRMESVFPDYGGDETDEGSEPDDSLRSRYVAGEIDHETFRRRLDEKLAEPVDSAGPPAEDAPDVEPDPDDPIALLRARFARGEIDEATYRDRLEILRETADDAGPTESETPEPDATNPNTAAREPERND